MNKKSSELNLIKSVTQIIENAYNHHCTQTHIQKNRPNIPKKDLDAISDLLKKAYPNQNKSNEISYCYQLAYQLSEANLDIIFIITGVVYFLFKIDNPNYKNLLSSLDSRSQKIYNLLCSSDSSCVTEDNIHNIVNLFDGTFGKDLLTLYTQSYSYYLKFLIENQDKYNNLSAEQIKQIIFEAFLICPTLCDKYNMQHEQNLLSEYAFKLIAPDAIDDIQNKLIKNFFQNRLLFEEIILKIVEKIKNNNIPAKIYFRVKSYHSIWIKALNKKVFYDILGARIITNSIDHCYLILENINKLFSVVELKNFIEYPKANGYQSIHAIISIKNELSMDSCIEIQIRTQVMNDYCKSGVASHEEYKLDKYKKIFENKNCV